jgi:hypothetical protein
MMAHVADTPPALSEASKRKFPLHIDLIVSRLLEKEPNKRFSSIKEAEQAFLRGVSITNNWRKQRNKPNFVRPLLRTAVIVLSLSCIFALFRLNHPAPTSSQDTGLTEDLGVLTHHESRLLKLLTAEPMTDIVDLNNQRITDAGMRCFANVHFVKRINMNGCNKITDVGLNYLVGLRLVNLLLCDTRLTDTGMQSLCQIPTLESLDISETEISNAGCKYLETLSRLKVLHINWTSVTGAALSNIGKLGNLEELHLDGDDVSGDLSAIATLDLRDLRLSETKLTDNDMTQLARMRSLLELDVSINKGITDAGLLKLVSLTNLRILDVSNCSTTEAGVTRLRHSLPLCEIRTRSAAPLSPVSLFQAKHNIPKLATLANYLSATDASQISLEKTHD